MNDKFMLSCRPRVREGFTEKLYQRLNQIEKGKTMEKNIHNQRRLNWKLVLAAFLVAIAGIFSFSSGARVFAGKLIDEIAGFFIDERTESPWADLVDEDGVLDVSNATVVIITPVAVDSILENPPFEFSMPEYVPEGFEIRADKAAEALSGTWISIPYRGNGDTRSKEITFMAETGTPTLSIGLNASEEITINNQPALLVRGDWSRDGSHTWDYDLGWTIYWTIDKTNYRLILRSIDKDLLDDYLVELIKMAESVH